jgi:hypothetical protein
LVEILFNENWSPSEIFDNLTSNFFLNDNSDLTIVKFDKQNKVVIGYKKDGCIFIGCSQVGDIEGFETRRAKLQVLQTIDLQNNGVIEPAFVLSFASFSDDELMSVCTIFAGLYDLNRKSFGLDTATKAAQGFKDFFVKFAPVKVSREYEIGLFGELSVILASNDRETLIQAWHLNPYSTYDFSFKGQRLEVKTSSNPSRQVWLRSSQTVDLTQDDLTYLSIYAPEDQFGQSINDLVIQINKNINKASQVELDQKLSLFDLSKCKLKFDLKKTISSFKFISGKDVPIIKNTDIRVSAINWRTSFELLSEIDNNNYWFQLIKS